MKLIDGLLDYSTKWTLPNVYLFTGNSIIKNNGAIVMGRGAAKQVRDSYPGVDKAFGLVIEAQPYKLIQWVRLVGHPDDTDEQHIGWFKVKNHWRENAKVELIQMSSERLADIARKRSEITFHMNYPGIGNGKLNIEAVRRHIEKMPDNVWVYK
jgi:uncharacterized protein YjiS (DUF1127 family)